MGAKIVTFRARELDSTINPTGKKKIHPSTLSTLLFFIYSLFPPLYIYNTRNTLKKHIYLYINKRTIKQMYE